MPGSRLAFYRRKKGLTQEQLSEKSGVTTRTIQRIEKGAVVPHIQTLKMLADCLDIEIELLIDQPAGDAITDKTQKNNSLAPFFHLLGLIGLAFPVLNIILPLILWLLKRDQNQEYDRQGKQVLNFHLTLTMLFFPSVILMIYVFPLGFTLTLSIYAFMLVMSLVNLFKSINSKPINYPFSFPFFKT